MLEHGKLNSETVYNRKTKHRGFKDIQLQADITLQLLVLIFVLIFRLFLQRLFQYKPVLL